MSDHDRLLCWMFREGYFDLQLMIWQIRECGFVITLDDVAEGVSR